MAEGPTKTLTDQSLKVEAVPAANLCKYRHIRNPVRIHRLWPWRKFSLGSSQTIGSPSFSQPTGMSPVLPSASCPRTKSWQLGQKQQSGVPRILVSAAQASGAAELVYMTKESTGRCRPEHLQKSDVPPRPDKSEAMSTSQSPDRFSTKPTDTPIVTLTTSETLHSQRYRAASAGTKRAGTTEHWVRGGVGRTGVCHPAGWIPNRSPPGVSMRTSPLQDLCQRRVKLCLVFPL